MKHFVIFLLILLGIGGTLVSAYRVLYAPTEESIAAESEIPYAPEAIPTRLSVPSLSIDAEVQVVGVKEDGTMATPSNYTDVAWYKYAAAPGAYGKAVFAGHLDNSLGLPGVFKNLENIEEGDDVYATNAGGKRLHFKVVRKVSMPYDIDDTSDVFGPGEGSELVLITCEGDWDTSVRKYAERLIVYAELVQ